MASEENKSLQQVFAPIFKADGFRKDGPTWRKTSEEAIVVFNIQGSQWARQFYLNLGAYFRVLGASESPPENHCHLRVRAAQLVPDRVWMGQLLDFERPMDVQVRLGELADLVQCHVLPWLRAMSSLLGARGYFDAHPAPAMFIAAEARALLGLSSSG